MIPKPAAPLDSMGKKPEGAAAGPGASRIPPGPICSIGTLRAAGPGAIGMPPGPMPPGVQQLGCEGPGAIGIPPGPMVCAAAEAGASAAPNTAANATAGARGDLLRITVLAHLGASSQPRPAR